MIPQDPDPQALNAQDDPASPEAQAPAAGETWVDDNEEPPPALGSEIHGALQERLECLTPARRPGFVRWLMRVIFGRGL